MSASSGCDAWLLLALAISSAAACGGGSAPGPPANRDTISLETASPTGRDSVAVFAETPEVERTPVPAETLAMGSWTAGIVDMPTGGGISTIVSVRAARHEEFDRVVWGIDGPLPGVHAEYVDEPVRSCGSGEPVALPGDAWLEVRIAPANAHTENGRATITDRRIAPALPVVLEIAVSCDFEAVVTWVLAVRSPEPFRLTLLENPSRLVVDVRHPR